VNVRSTPLQRRGQSHGSFEDEWMVPPLEPRLKIRLNNIHSQARKLSQG